MKTAETTRATAVALPWPFTRVVLLLSLERFSFLPTPTMTTPEQVPVGAAGRGTPRRLLGTPLGPRVLRGESRPLLVRAFV